MTAALNRLARLGLVIFSQCFGNLCRSILPCGPFSFDRRPRRQFTKYCRGMTRPDVCLLALMRTSSLGVLPYATHRLHLGRNRGRANFARPFLFRPQINLLGGLLPLPAPPKQTYVRCAVPRLGEGAVTGSPHLVMDAWPHHHGRPNCFGFLRQPSRPTGAEVGCDLALRRRHWLASSTMVIPPISKIQFQRNPNIVVPINRSMW